MRTQILTSITVALLLLCPACDQESTEEQLERQDILETTVQEAEDRLDLTPVSYDLGDDTSCEDDLVIRTAHPDLCRVFECIDGMLEVGPLVACIC